MRPVVLGGAILFFICTIFLIAATGDTEFSTVNGGGITIYYGAFQVCYNGRTSNCQSIDNNCNVNIPSNLGGQQSSVTNSCSEFHAFQAFLLLGLLTLIAATFTAFFATFWEGVGYVYATLILGGISDLCVMISFACFADITSSSTSSRGASFALEVTVWVLEIVALVVFGVGALVLEGGGGTQPK